MKVKTMMPSDVKHPQVEARKHLVRGFHQFLIQKAHGDSGWIEFDAGTKKLWMQYKPEQDTLLASFPDENRGRTLIEIKGASYYTMADWVTVVALAYIDGVNPWGTTVYMQPENWPPPIPEGATHDPLTDLLHYPQSPDV